MVVPIYNVRKFTGKSSMTEAGYRKWETVIRGFIDGEAEGLPEDRVCPDCGVSTSDFESMQA
jgi:hypothetical protein